MTWLPASQMMKKQTENLRKRLTLIHYQCKMFYTMDQSNIIIYVTFKVIVVKVKSFKWYSNSWLDDYVKIIYTEQKAKEEPMPSLLNPFVPFCLLMLCFCYIREHARFLQKKKKKNLAQLGSFASRNYLHIIASRCWCSHNHGHKWSSSRKCFIWRIWCSFRCT